MESIASKLKARRESLNISLEKISNDTRISLHHLRSLETGQYDDLPGGMYKRAILRVYCDEIGLDKNEILQSYDDEISPHAEKPVVSSAAARDSKVKTHTAVIWSLLFLVGLGIFLNREWFVSALFPYFTSDTGSRSGVSRSEKQPAPVKTVKTNTTANKAVEAQTANNPESAASAVSSVAGDKVVETRPEQTVKATPAETPAAAIPEMDAADLQQPLRLEIVGREECWLSVNRDDSGAVTKILSPGDVEFFTATRTIALTVGNAGGVSLRINGRAAKTLGQSGQVIHLTIDEGTLKNFIDPSAS